MKGKSNCKAFKRAWSMMLTIALIVTMVPFTNVKTVKAATNAEITQKLDDMRPLLENKYWNAGIIPSIDNDSAKWGITSSSKGKSNSFAGGTGCNGFAYWLATYLFQENPRKKWETITYPGKRFSPEPGDVVGTGSTNHTAIVWKVEGDYIQFVECWGGSKSKNIIKYGGYNGDTSSISALASRVVTWRKHPKNLPVTGVPSSGVSESVMSSIYISGAQYPTGNLSQGQMFGIRGTIHSVYKLSNVEATIYNNFGNVVQEKSVVPNKTSYDLRTTINNAMVFNTLGTGSYRFVVSATDVKGVNKNVIDQNFSVGSVSMPSISTANVAGGVQVTISAGCDVYYSLNGSSPIGGTKYTGPFLLTNNATVKAVAEYYGAYSNVAERQVTASKCKTPTISSYMDTGAMMVTIEAESGAATYYTTDGSQPTASGILYVGAFQLSNSATIKAVSVKSGYADSAIGAADVVVTEPAVPKVTLGCNSKIAQGDAAKVIWDTQAVAYSYIIKLYKDNAIVEQKEVKGNSAVFTLEDAGDYEITVSAKNFKGESKENYPPVRVTAMAPCYVTFADYDDNVISVQEVKYGYTASLPVNPSRRGYNFNKWDNNAVYQPITQNFITKATYTKKKYIVKFIDDEGSALAAQQEVLFDEAVSLPPDPTIDKVGFAFMGWRCSSTDENSALDYEHVDANMTLQAVFDWGNKDFPVIASITKANQNDANSYSVGVSLQNWPDEKTYARMLVTLKTSTGKMVKTITQDVTLEKDECKTIDNIELISDKVATNVEVNLIRLDGQKTCGAYAEAVSQSTTSYSNTKWSEWSTEVPSAGLETEEKIMYRYRDKVTTTSTASYLDGWTQYGSPSVEYGAWGPTLSTTNNPGSSDTQQITGSSTVYNYYHYCCNKYSGINNVDSIPYGSGKHYYHTLVTGSPLPAFSMGDKGGKQPYGGKGKASGCQYNFYAWFSNGSTTTYYYQTRSKTITYYYYTWGNWSDYSDVAVASTGDRQVETQKYYRYKINLNTPTDGEDNSGEVYTQEGTIRGTDLDLTGKRANVLVYKSTNNDPTENQLEYVGQTVIGAGNTYAFSFVPKESPDEAKSNYIVALAMEGQTSLYNVDVISRTKPQYHVSFFDKDGNEISNCDVEEGKSAEVPDAPAVEGYRFVGWDKDTTNVEADRVITATYQPIEYAVVYVDWENNAIEMMQLPYGTEVPSPATEPIEGKDFVGWDKLLEGKTTVSDNTIISAMYDTKTFKVQFVDGDGNVISDQEIPYGESATLPKQIDGGEKQFLGWSNENAWWKVTKDMTVEPILVYEKTTSTPIYSIEDTYLGGELTLEAGPDSRIFYTIDYKNEENDEQAGNEDSVSEGSDEVSIDELSSEMLDGDSNRNWQEYQDSVLLYDDATIHFYAQSEGQNNSEIVDVNYTYKEVENPYVKTAIVSVPLCTVAPGQQVQIPVSLKSNPGIMGVGMTIRYDTTVFSDVTVEKDKLFSEGAFDYNVDEKEGKIFLIWSNTEDMKNEGCMFTIAMTASEGAEMDDYPLEISYEQEDTFNDNWMDVKLDIQSSNIRVGNIVCGDANQDGRVNNKDVAYIACSLVGKVTLSEQGKLSADINGDGKLDNKDVAKLARYLVGKETTIGGK